MYAPHEDVAGKSCPHCKKATGTIWSTYDRARGDVEYRVEAHGRMGNKSYRDDEQVGEYCEPCGYTRYYK